MQDKFHNIPGRTNDGTPLQRGSFKLKIGILKSSKDINMINECDVSELKEKLDTKANIQFIDCREVPEWNEGHIPGATLLPLSELEAKYESALKDKNANIFIQCRSGKRSMNACMFLLSKGYTNLTNVEGGIMSWMQAGFTVITE